MNVPLNFAERALSSRIRPSRRCAGSTYSQADTRAVCRNSTVPNHVPLIVANAQHENTDTYRLHRAKPDSPVAVLNQDGFFMAEYNPATGATAWHRVVPATKRESVEKRLAQQFPAIVQKKVAASRPHSKSRKS